MAMTSTERSRKWRKAHPFAQATNGCFGAIPGPKPLTMARLVAVVEKAGPFGITEREAYRKLSAHRQLEAWEAITRAAFYNQDGTQAPVQTVGDGRRGNPRTLRISEDWDDTRDWDQEQD